MVKHPFEQHHGGFVVYLHNSITYSQHIAPHFTSSTSSTAAMFHISSPILPKPFILVSLYMSGKAPIHDWDKLIHFFTCAPFTYTDDGMPVLVMGDMNAHDPMWDDSYPPSYSEPGGSKLAAFLSQDNDWHLLNFRMSQLVPTRISSAPNQRNTVIDLAMCNQFNFVQQFDVNDYDTLVSDHKPIHVSLYTKPSSCLSLPQRRVWRTSNPNIPWDVFQTMLADLLAPWRTKWEPYLSCLESFHQHNIDSCWNELRDIITQTAMYVIGKKVVSVNHQHWFTLNPVIPTLHKQYVTLRRRRAICRRNDMQVPTTLERKYQQARHQFRTAMREAKQACWEELVEQVSHDHRIVWTAWHRTIPSSSIALPPFTDPSSSPSQTPIDNLNIMTRYIQHLNHPC